MQVCIFLIKSWTSTFEFNLKVFRKKNPNILERAVTSLNYKPWRRLARATSAHAAWSIKIHCLCLIIWSGEMERVLDLHGSVFARRARSCSLSRFQPWKWLMMWCDKKVTFWKIGLRRHLKLEHGTGTDIKSQRSNKCEIFFSALIMDIFKFGIL